jgi:isopentenyl diphosphate isomerase/L-lactate dehydrogenase-like FMN-dependent dehydrogenase
VFQLRAVARQKLDAAAWHFIANGADDGETMRANREVFDNWALRVRRLVDVSSMDLSVELLGERLPHPVILAPVGNQLALHPDGELATARAAARRGALMICSTITSHSIGEIAAAASGPKWFQLYASSDQALNRHLLAGAERAGCGTVVLTVDSPTRGNREGERWFGPPVGGGRARMGNFEGYDGKLRIGDASMTWSIVDWLRDNTGMNIVLKGIVTREDAALCRKRGVDAIIVSNHGGRQEESNRATLASLPEVLDGVKGDLPVMIDGGFRRGTDVFKALALGARAVCIGRPYLWGLAAFGEAGVTRSLSIIESELQRIMQFAGTTSIDAINSSYITRA